MLIVVLSLASAGCSSTVSLKPASDANNPYCAEVSVRLPSSILNEDRRWTDAQSTGAWGSPVSVVLRCGVSVPGPSVLPCYTFGGVDWLADEYDADVQRATTFGRDPAVEVIMDRDADLDFASVLEEFGRIISAAVPKNANECL